MLAFCICFHLHSKTVIVFNIEKLLYTLIYQAKHNPNRIKSMRSMCFLCHTAVDSLCIVFGFVNCKHTSNTKTRANWKRPSIVHKHTFAVTDQAVSLSQKNDAVEAVLSIKQRLSSVSFILFLWFSIFSRDFNFSRMCFCAVI